MVMLMMAVARTAAVGLTCMLLTLKPDAFSEYFQSFLQCILLVQLSFEWYFLPLRFGRPIYVLSQQPNCLQVTVPFAPVDEVGGYVFPEPVECADWRSVPQRTMPALFIQASRLS